MEIKNTNTKCQPSLLVYTRPANSYKSACYDLFCGLHLVDTLVYTVDTFIFLTNL